MENGGITMIMSAAPELAAKWMRFSTISISPYSERQCVKLRCLRSEKASRADKKSTVFPLRIGIGAVMLLFAEANFFY
jgi:hypothetical protein